MTAQKQMLSIRNLRTYFSTEDGLVKAVDGVSFDIAKGKTFALVGESGCGKSVTAFSILDLIPSPPGQIQPGSSIRFCGTELIGMKSTEMRKVRGAQISMVFQEPMSSLNPVYTCGNQIVEAIRLHQKVKSAEAREIAIEMLNKVGIPAPAQRFKEYPHQMSGGMKQRIMIAMALCCNPELLIADEPTTALDVTIQAQILDLLKDIQRESDLSVMLITHDLGVVAETAHDVGVMYASKIVERTSSKQLFETPLHPYTQGLFRSMPRLDNRADRLETIPGNVPNPLHFPSGCKFHPRCPLGRNDAKCNNEEPDLRLVAPDHWCACWKCPGYESAEGQTARSITETEDTDDQQ